MRAVARLLVLVSLAVAGVSAPAAAWNDKGHMAVAYVAYQQLTPAVRARADQLLRLNPFYRRWLAMVPATLPPSERNLAIFMIAATWADQIKSDAGYRDDGTQNGNRPGGPLASRNTGYADLLRHKYWHFVDTPEVTLEKKLTPLTQAMRQKSLSPAGRCSVSSGAPSQRR